MKTRIIHTKIWRDGYFSELNRTEKLLFIYLITNPYIGLSGIYELPDKYIKIELGLSQKELDKTKAKFEKDKKFKFYKSYVIVINVNRYQAFIGEKNERAKEKELELLPTEVLDTLSIPYRYPIDSPSNKKSIINNKKLISNNKKLEIKKKKLIDKISVPF